MTMEKKGREQQGLLIADEGRILHLLTILLEERIVMAATVVGFTSTPDELLGCKSTGSRNSNSANDTSDNDGSKDTSTDNSSLLLEGECLLAVGSLRVCQTTVSSSVATDAVATLIKVRVLVDLTEASVLACLAAGTTEAGAKSSHVELGTVTLEVGARAIIESARVNCADVAIIALLCHSPETSLILASVDVAQVSLVGIRKLRALTTTGKDVASQLVAGIGGSTSILDTPNDLLALVGERAALIIETDVARILANNRLCDTSVGFVIACLGGAGSVLDTLLLVQASGSCIATVVNHTDRNNTLDIAL